MVTGQVCRLSPVVSFQPKMGLVVPDAPPHELVVLLDMAALHGHTVSDIADTAVSTAIHNREVWLVLLARRRRHDLADYLCHGFCERRAILV